LHVGTVDMCSTLYGHRDRMMMKTMMHMHGLRDDAWGALWNPWGSLGGLSSATCTRRYKYTLVYAIETGRSMAHALISRVGGRHAKGSEDELMWDTTSRAETGVEGWTGLVQSKTNGRVLFDSRSCGWCG
jgi:hypothetical protein